MLADYQRKSWMSRNLSPFLTLFLLLVIPSLIFPDTAAAETDPPPRKKSFTIHYSEYEWWLTDWEDDSVRCTVFTDRLGNPDLQDVFYQCEPDVYRQWSKTTACQEANKPTQDTCQGLYLHLAGQEPREKVLELELPVPEAWVSINNCQPLQNGFSCSELPWLTIVADEPLPNESIINIQGTVNRNPFHCKDKRCDVPLRPTTESGAELEFWAESSYGDRSEKYHGRYRVLSDHDPSGTGEGWSVHLISDRENPLPDTGCAGSWESFPAVGAPLPWLANPGSEVNLATAYPYTYLAGKLIQHQIVDGSDCNNWGLTGSGYANPCGLEKARDEVLRWQNAFDPYILQASKETQIPSQLLKRIFALESQFWPETVEHYYIESGFGHLTNLGADTTFFWNENFYREYCPLALHESRCETPYAHLEIEEQEILRTTLLNRTHIEQEQIIQGVDPSIAQENINTFANSFLANCRQVDFLIRVKTHQAPGVLTSYQDLWKFSLVGYHGGSGCFSKALESILADDLPLDWEHMALELREICPSTIDYVRQITQ